MRTAQINMSITHEGKTYYDLDVEVTYHLVRYTTEADEHHPFGRHTEHCAEVDECYVVDYSMKDHESIISEPELNVLLNTTYEYYVQKILNDTIDISDELDYDIND